MEYSNCLSSRSPSENSFDLFPGRGWRGERRLGNPPLVTLKRHFWFPVHGNLEMPRKLGMNSTTKSIELMIFHYIWNIQLECYRTINALRDERFRQCHLVFPTDYSFREWNPSINVSESSDSPLSHSTHLCFLHLVILQPGEAGLWLHPNLGLDSR